MKKSRFTEQQIAFALQQAEGGTSVDEVCRKMGICQATFFRWKKVYGAFDAIGSPTIESSLRKRSLRLRKLVADLTLDKEMLSEVIKKAMTPHRGREMIDFVRTCFRVSIRRACRAVPVCRATYHYRLRRADQRPLRQRIREIAETRARYGYRRIHIPFAPRRLACEREARASALLLGRPANAAQTAPPSRHGQAPGRSQHRYGAEPGVGHGLDA